MDGTKLPNKEKKRRSKMSWWNQKFTVEEKKEKKKRKEKQNGMTKPKDYCRGIGALAKMVH